MLEIDQREREGRLRSDHLHRNPVEAVKGGPQRFVAPHHRSEAPFQRLDIERTPDTQRDRNDVGRAVRLQLCQYPEPLLGERQGHRAGARDRLRRGERFRQVRSSGRFGHLDQSGDRGRLEEGA